MSTANIGTLALKDFLSVENHSLHPAFVSTSTHRTPVTPSRKPEETFLEESKAGRMSEKIDSGGTHRRNASATVGNLSRHTEIPMGGQGPHPQAWTGQSSGSWEE